MLTLPSPEHRRDPRQRAGLVRDLDLQTATPGADRAASPRAAAGPAWPRRRSPRRSAASPSRSRRGRRGAAHEQVDRRGDLVAVRDEDRRSTAPGCDAASRVRSRNPPAASSRSPARPPPRSRRGPSASSRRPAGGGSRSPPGDRGARASAATGRAPIALDQRLQASVGRRVGRRASARRPTRCRRPPRRTRARARIARSPHRVARHEPRRAAVRRRASRDVADDALLHARASVTTASGAARERPDDRRRDRRDRRARRRRGRRRPPHPRGEVERRARPLAAARAAMPPDRVPAGHAHPGARRRHRHRRADQAGADTATATDRGRRQLAASRSSRSALRAVEVDVRRPRPGLARSGSAAGRAPPSGIAPATGISRAQSSGTSPMPIRRAASAGNALADRRSTVNRMLIEVVVRDAVALQERPRSRSVEPRARPRRCPRTPTIAPRAARTFIRTPPRDGAVAGDAASPAPVARQGYEEPSVRRTRRRAGSTASPSASTSSGRSSRTRPGARPPSSTGPMRTRTSRVTGSPTASRSRRTSRLRPSVITSGELAAVAARVDDPHRRRARAGPSSSSTPRRSARRGASPSACPPPRRGTPSRPRSAGA